MKFTTVAATVIAASIVLAAAWSQALAE